MQRKKMFKVLCLMCLLMIFSSGILMAVGIPTNLRCEGMIDPIHIEPAAPRLSWTLVNDFSGMDHESWRVQAASSRESLLSDKPKAILQLRIEYAEGTVDWVVTDESWKAARSPVVLNGIFNGQVYDDARLDQSGWNEPGLNDSQWYNALLMNPPDGMLASTNMAPERVTEILEAFEITETLHHSFIFKFPRITTGQPRLKVSGPAGTRVVMRSFEVFDDRHDTHVNRQGPFQTDTYILKGEGVEYFEPGFAYHGFQYIELTGYPGEPDKESLKVAVIHTDFDKVGTFSSSSDLINGIQNITMNSYLTNYHGLPLDCPTREKSGWTADGYLAAETGFFNFDAFNAYSKWINDIIDCQHEDGRIPDIVPTASWGYNGHFDWDCVIIYMPWYSYLYTGNTEILSRSYEAMKACYNYYFKLADNGILMNGRGDHALNKTPTYRPVTITALLCRKPQKTSILSTSDPGCICSG